MQRFESFEVKRGQKSFRVSTVNSDTNTLSHYTLTPASSIKF